MPLYQRLVLIALAGTFGVSTSAYFLTRPLEEPVGDSVQTMEVVREKTVSEPQPVESIFTVAEPKNATFSKVRHPLVVQTAPASAAHRPNPLLAEVTRPASRAIAQDVTDENVRSEKGTSEGSQKGRFSANGQRSPSRNRSNPEVTSQSSSSAAAKAGKNSAKSGENIAAEAVKKPRLPVVLQDLGGAVVTPVQAVVIARQQEDFIQQVGGEYQNPNDPAYLDRWISAERSAYGKLRVQIGDIAANRLSLIAAQNAYRAANAGQ